MKQILTSVLLGLASLTFAQVSSATINYKVNFDGELPEGLPADMFKNMSMTLAFNGESSRTDFNMGIMNMTTVTDGKQTMSLFNSMGMKFGTIEDGDDSEVSLFNTNVSEEDKPDIKITGNKKTIAGYECTEAIITTDDGKITVYYTDKIKPNKMNKDFDMGINGFPLEFSILASGMKMKISATEVKKSTNADFSMTIPEGYQKMSADQLKSMMR